MSKYQVTVGNVGTVYDGDDQQKADEMFDEYVEQSRSGYGRAAHEPVCLMNVDGEEFREFVDHLTRYIKTGQGCPVCGDEADTEGESITVEGVFAIQPMHCLDCDHEWTSRYRLERAR